MSIKLEENIDYTRFMDISCKELDGQLLNTYQLPLIKEVEFPEGVEAIQTGNGTYRPFRSAETIILPQSLKLIYNSSFSFANIKSLKIPKNVKYIGPNAFAYCFQLKVIAFENFDDIVFGTYCFAGAQPFVVLVYNKDINDWEALAQDDERLQKLVTFTGMETFCYNSSLADLGPESIKLYLGAVYDSYI